jgi:serine/threonine protein kinase
VGTTYWMAPELFARKPQYTEKTDTYAYAMTIWELVTQQVPYADADNTAMVPMWVMNGDRETIPEDCPELFRDIITGCWAGNPSERPSLSQVITQLKQSAPLPLLPATTGPSSSHYAGNLGNVSSPLPLATSYDSIAVSSVGYQGNVSTPRPPTQLPSYGANTSSASSSGYQGNLAPPSSGFSVRPS